VKSLLEVAHVESMSDQDLATGLRRAIHSDCDKQTVIQLILAVKQMAGRLNLGACRRGTVALVLDRVITVIFFVNTHLFCDDVIFHFSIGRLISYSIDSY